MYMCGHCFGMGVGSFRLFVANTPKAVSQDTLLHMCSTVSVWNPQCVAGLCMRVVIALLNKHCNMFALCRLCRQCSQPLPPVR